jgi:2-oxoglutarate dehydrogenase E1 component
VRTANIAADYRQQFHADIIVDLVCYRRAGHDEIDEPTFTQSVMYRTIADHPVVSEISNSRIIAEGLISSDEADAYSGEYFGQLDAAYGALAGYRPNLVYTLDPGEAPRTGLEDRCNAPRRQQRYRRVVG